MALSFDPYDETFEPDTWGCARAVLAGVLVILAVIVALVLIMRGCGAVPPPAYAEPCDPVWEGKVANAAQYIARVNPHVDADAVARMIVQASAEAGLEPPGGYRLLLAVAKYESSFRPKAVNPTSGCRGLLQVHPVHFKPMRAAGLDPDDPYDCLLYGALMISWSLKKGRSLRAALQPWAVRRRALAELQRIPHAEPLYHMEAL